MSNYSKISESLRAYSAGIRNSLTILSRVAQTERKNRSQEAKGFENGLLNFAQASRDHAPIVRKARC